MSAPKPPPIVPPTIPTGELTLAQRQTFERWINGKSPLIGKCPVCGDRKYTILDHLVDLPIYRGGNMIIGGGPNYPNVGLVCTNCGTTQLVNAVISGVVSDGSQPPATAPAPSAAPSKEKLDE